LNGEVISLASRKPTEAPDILHRLEGVVAIFNAIEAGELLAAFPECEVARLQHQTALTLLAVAKRELDSLYRDIHP
jgi:hypothetical protein